LVAAISYVVVIGAIMALQLRENRRAFATRPAQRLRWTLRALPVPTLSSLFVGAAIVLRGEAVLAAFVPGLAPATFGDYNGPATVVLRQLAADAEPPMAVTAVVPDAAAPAPLAMDLPVDRISVGAYDPHLALTGQPLDIEHWYVRQDDPTLLAGALAHTRDQRTLMVTIEPWPAPGSSDTDVLGNVVGGASDDQLDELARIAAANRPQVILVRWGHEMELSNLYPWGAQDPDLYKQAFRRVADIFRAEGADNVRFVWSPAGNENAVDYYPGGDVVDYVGFTALADAGWDAGFGLPPQSFDDIVGARYRRLAPLDKPVLVAELGVSGTSLHKTAWLAEAGRSLSLYPQLRALVYFDDQNPPMNHLRTQPDWRIGADPLGAFLGLSGGVTASNRL
jgi:hypothetical protein